MSEPWDFTDPTRWLPGMCCPLAVHDSTAGWWCPEHGDQMEDGEQSGDAAGRADTGREAE